MDSTSPDAGLLAAPGVLAGLGWIDLTAVSILTVFFVLGLLRGFFWQFGRIATLILALVLTGVYGDAAGARIAPWFSASTDPRVPLYVAYFALFLMVVVVVSLVTYLLERFLQRGDLTFADRVGGGVLGVGTGACIVLALLAMLTMVGGTGTSVVQAAERSRSMAYGRAALSYLGDNVPAPVRSAFGLETPAETPAEAASEAPDKASRRR